MNNRLLWILVLSLSLVSLIFAFIFPLPQKQKIQQVILSGIANLDPETSQVQERAPAVLIEQKKRQDHMKAKCAESNHQNSWDKVNTKILLSKEGKPRLYYSDKHEVIVCGIPKCASTEWRKALLIVEGDVEAETPEEIEHELAFTLAKKKRFLLNTTRYSEEELDKRLNGYMRIVTVREPLERVVSAYIDKMLPGGTAVSLYKEMSRNIHRRFAKDKENLKEDWATFEEFVDNILAAPGEADVHWQQYTTICDPCSMHYDYIAKLETFVADATYISQKTGIEKRLLFDEKKKPHADSQEKHQKYEKYLTELPKEKLKRLFEIYRTEYELFDYPIPDYIKSI